MLNHYLIYLEEFREFIKLIETQWHPFFFKETCSEVRQKKYIGFLYYLSQYFLNKLKYFRMENKLLKNTSFSSGRRFVINPLSNLLSMSFFMNFLVRLKILALIYITRLDWIGYLVEKNVVLLKYYRCILIKSNFVKFKYNYF